MFIFIANIQQIRAQGDPGLCERSAEISLHYMRTENIVLGGL